MSFPEQPFGFVAGRWVLSIGDTPDDPDRAPDYVPVKDGAIVFTPQVTHRVAADGTGWAGIIKDRVLGGVGERGQLVDAEGHDHLALAVGVYSVSYDFGPGMSWPSHYIEVKPEHAVDAPLWLPPIAPPPEGPMIENRVVTIPEGGRDGQVLVWDGAGFSWADPPKGDKGDTGDLEFMSGTPRIVNLALGREYATTSYLRTYMSAPIPMAEGDIIYTHRVYSNSEGANHNYSGAIAIHDGSLHTYLADAWRPYTGAKFIKSGRVKITSPVPENATISIYGENPPEPVTFSDVNIINLTQVYGSGNEPSLEYMDALVEKHGGYIDDEQYAVGDALHALTLAGQGMGVRVDNSVGTRVFLDYPGGSTMLHGDTGWRNVEDMLDPAFVPASSAGRVRVRRVNNQVFWTIRVSLVEPLLVAAAQNMVTAIPSQFRQLPAGYGTVGAGLSFPSRTMFGIENRVTPEILTITGTGPGDWSVDESLAASFSYSTNAPWPDTLPGTPA